MKPQLALELVRQDALQTEKISKNGYQRTAAVVCKGLPFTIEVKSTEDLRQIELYTSLLYDYKDSPTEPERPVESSIHVNVMEYKVHVNSSYSASVEIRIKVLSSQLSSLFRVKVSGEKNNGNSKTEKTRVDILSNPIKVISKLVHPKKEQSQKKTSTELIEEAVSRLESQNAENAKLISLLCSDITLQPSSQLLGKRKISSDSEQDDSNSDYESDVSIPSKRTKANPKDHGTSDSSDEFETSFRNFIEIIARSKFARDRTNTFRRYLHNIPLSAEEHSVLACLVDGYTNRSPDDSSLAFPSPAPEQLQSFNNFNHPSNSQAFSNNTTPLPDDFYKMGIFSEIESIHL